MMHLVFGIDTQLREMIVLCEEAVIFGFHFLVVEVFGCEQLTHLAAFEACYVHFSKYCVDCAAYLAGTVTITAIILVLKLNGKLRSSQIRT